MSGIGNSIRYCDDHKAMIDAIAGGADRVMPASTL